MTRFLFSIGLIASSASGAFAVIIAPVPRLTEWPNPAGEKPEPMPGEAEDPAKILERVTKNARSAGDRLKELDAGEETRKTQDQVLQDIDRLLKQNENSPQPPSGGGGGGMSEMPPPPGGGGNSGMKPPPPGGGMNPMPMGNSGGRQRPPRGSGMPESQPMNPGGMKEPMMPPGGGMKDPMMQPGTPMNAGNPSGNPMGAGSKAPPLPNEDPFTKQVWGHLPEKLRQQASQYYREQYMPKYQEMLKRYYSDLAEREKPSNKK